MVSQFLGRMPGTTKLPVLNAAAAWLVQGPHRMYLVVRPSEFLPEACQCPMWVKAPRATVLAFDGWRTWQ